MGEEQRKTYQATVVADEQEKVYDVEVEEIDLFLKQKNQLKKWETSYENIRKNEDKKRKKERKKANKQYSELYYSIATYFENISEEEQKIMRTVVHENAKRAECGFSVGNTNVARYLSALAVILSSISLLNNVTISGVKIELPGIFIIFEVLLILMYVLFLILMSNFWKKYKRRAPFYTLMESIIKNHLEAL